MKASNPRLLAEEVSRTAPIWLFLDYDGTLADFAPTPDDILPDPELIQILGELASCNGIRLGVISGRRLSHIQRLIPHKGIILAGTYGIELQTEEGEVVHQLNYTELRPALEMLKPVWEGLIAGRAAFYLEDKGWSLAIHARFADDAEAAQVLTAAQEAATRLAITENFRLLGGHKFLEASPKLASKASSLESLLRTRTRAGAFLVYIGDDDKDEDAFLVVRKNGGLAVVVAADARPTSANYRLESPQAVRQFLSALLEILYKRG